MTRVRKKKEKIFRLNGESGLVEMDSQIQMDSQNEKR